MGGNALKEYGARRYDAVEYRHAEKWVIKYLTDLGLVCYKIPYVRNKETFGDMDIVVKQTPTSKSTLIDSLSSLMVPFKKNGPVVSFLYMQLQVDVIFTPKDHIDFAVKYYSYNDMGNLVGRIFHKLGLKFGHDGVWYIFRDGTHVLGEILLTTDFDEALQFIQLDVSRYEEGFESLEDMFRFVCSSPYFQKSIYQFENRNHTARVRDRKRPSYNKFLEYINNSDNVVMDGLYIPLERKEEYLPFICSYFDNFSQQYFRLDEERKKRKEVKEKYPTERIIEITGLQGKLLGEFIKFLKEGIDWDSFVLDNDTQIIDDLVVRKRKMF